MLFAGIVEDNIDPLKLGRCKVRIFGKHTEDKSKYPTEDLPYAQSLSIGTSIDGEGNFSFINNGDLVIVSFLDTEEQKPIILGTLPKIVKTLPDFDIGFSDPNGEHPNSDFLDESSISRLARNENISDTIIQDKKDDVKTGVSCVGVNFDEPETAYNTEYPKNKVISTKYHVIELDDTDGCERLHIYHKSGSFIEYHPNGDQVEKVKAKKIMIVESDEDKFIGGNFNVHVDGDKNEEISGSENVKIGGDDIVEITGSKDETINGGLNMRVTGTGQIEFLGTANINVTGVLNITGSGPVNITGSPLSLN